MFFVGERVDDRKAPPSGGELQRLLLAERAQHQRVHPAFQVPGDVLERFAYALREFGGQIQRVRPELADGDLERGAGT
jgi:hypothetical protein